MKVFTVSAVVFYENCGILGVTSDTGAIETIKKEFLDSRFEAMGYNTPEDMNDETLFFVSEWEV